MQTLNSGAQTVRVGTILLTRTTSPTATSDSGLGIFDKVTTSNVSSSVTYDTNVGTCYLTSTHPASGTVTETPLDAGPELTITGPSGTMQMPEAGGNPGTYQANLGASSPLPGQGAKPPYLSPGAYTVSNGSGGADVGSFSGTVTKQPDFTWTNEGQITSVNRSQPLTVTWTGGDPTAVISISGNSTTSDGASAGFVCTAPVSAGTFTIPVSILQALPPSATIDGTLPGGFVALETYNASSIPTPSGLDELVFEILEIAEVTLLYQ